MNVGMYACTCMFVWIVLYENKSNIRIMHMIYIHTYIQYVSMHKYIKCKANIYLRVYVLVH